MWVLWYWSKFLSFEEKATFVISCQTFWGYLPNLVATEDDASQPLNLKSFFRIVSVKFVVFFLIALSASQIFTLEGDCLENSYINNSESHPLPVLPKPWSLPGINISIWATAHLPLPQPNINPKLLSIDCCWFRGEVGGLLPRYWYWSLMSILISCKQSLRTNKHFETL